MAKETQIAYYRRDHVGFHLAVFVVCAGHYGIERDRNVPCLIYATFNNRLVVYHNIQMSQIGSTNLIRRLEEDEEVHALMNVLNCDGETIR